MYIYVSLCFFIIVKSVQNSRYYAFKKAGRLIIPEFTLVLRCSNQVVQGKYSVTALTVTGKHSNYQNMATEFKSLAQIKSSGNHSICEAFYQSKLNYLQSIYFYKH